MRAFLIALTLALGLILAPFAVGAQSAATANDGPLFANATYTGAPACRDVILPQLNAGTALHLCAIVRRPAEGGSLHVVSLFTSDGEIGTVDMGQFGYADCFGADAWPSRFTETLKAVVNCKSGDGNDRRMVYVDTGIVALPEGTSAPRRRRRPRRYGNFPDYSDDGSVLGQLKTLIVGVGHDPRVVAPARALALYAIPIGIALVVGYLNSITNPAYYGVVALLSPFIRAVGEAAIDQLNKPTQNDTYPRPPAGAD